MRPDNTYTFTHRPEPASCPHEAELAAARAELAAAHMKIENLEVALYTGRKIGTAVGIIMANYKITDEAAFDLLVTASQRTNRKLRHIAHRVIETGDLGRWADVSGPTSEVGVPSAVR